VNRQVDGLSLIRALDSLHSNEAIEAFQDGFLDDLMCCLAARRSLVVVTRLVRTDALTPEVLARELPPEDVAFMLMTTHLTGPFIGSFNSEQKVCLRLASEDELESEELVLYSWIPEEETLPGYLRFQRLVPKDELTLEQSLHIGYFMDAIPLWGSTKYFIKESDRVNLAVDLIKGMENL
jgi:hypothetical protein